MATRALVVAAPSSGAGKTTITLAILHALKLAGQDIAAAKIGPDYIDPAFHAAASGTRSINLDPWAMDAATLIARARALPGDLLIIEAAMGALDGAGTHAKGSAADLATTLGAPLIMVLDAAKTGASITLPLSGLQAERPDLPIAGVLLNRLGSPRHLDIARTALARRGIPLLGHLFREPDLTLPERHLGLVQASEHPDLDAFFTTAAARISATTDLTHLAGCARPLPKSVSPNRLPPPGQRIAIARDTAFAFCYSHLIDDWRARGAEITTFSPLADEGPSPGADAIYLPGGYPELHAARLAQASTFHETMKKAANAGTTIYGECGGYMCLGQSLTDAGGTAYPMLGLLPVSTSFTKRRLHLGYRRLIPQGGPWSQPLNAHEFHYATVTEEAPDHRLFTAQDADSADLPPIGHFNGAISGSFAHIISPA